MKTPDLTRRITRYEQRLDRMMEDMARQIAAGARARVRRNRKQPQRPSPLADSIRAARMAAGGWRVSTDRPYARYVEFGTRHQPPRPFLTPATEEVKVTFAAGIFDRET